MTDNSWLAGEVTELTSVNDNLTRAASEEKRDLTGGEIEIINRNADRIVELQTQVETVQRAQSIRAQSLESIAMLGSAVDSSRQAEHEYKTAGEYIADVWRSGVGNRDAENRLRRYSTRVAAHQTTADNTGIVPDPIVGPVVNFIDSSRPVVSFVGPGNLPAGPTFYRPKVTQHTSVAAQAGEKTELVSQKMLITRLSVAVATLGGYVNVSRQDIDWSDPNALQMVIDDLAAVYAQQTENRAVDAWVAGGTAGGGTIPLTGGTAASISAVIWGAAAKVYAATKGQGRVFLGCGPDMLNLIAPAFAPINPTNGYGEGFLASNYGSGVMGTISGIPVVVSAGFDAGKAFVASTAAIEVYEQRVGALQVIEPSVLGVQVAYAGYFANPIIEATGVQLLVAA